MRVIRKFAKIMILPLMLLIGILHFVLNTATKLSSYLIGPLMLLIFGCGVYTVVKQLWSQTFLLALMEGDRELSPEMQRQLDHLRKQP